LKEAIRAPLESKNFILFCIIFFLLGSLLDSVDEYITSGAANRYYNSIQQASNSSSSTASSGSESEYLQLYGLFRECCSQDPELRPSFSQILCILEELEREHLSKD